MSVILEHNRCLTIGETGHAPFDKQTHGIMFIAPCNSKTQFSVFVTHEDHIDYIVMWLEKAGVKKKFINVIKEELIKQIRCCFYLFFHDTHKGVVNHGAVIVTDKKKVIPFYFYRGEKSKTIIRHISAKMDGYFKQKRREENERIRFQSLS